MQQQKIEFKKERQFGSVIGDSLKFLKQNFRPFFAAIILIVGPVLLLMGLGYGYMQSTIMPTIYGGNIYKTGGPSINFNGTYFLSIGALVFFGLLTHVLLNSVVYNYMGLYDEKPFGEKITIAEISKRVWSSLGRMIGSVITLMLVTTIIVFVIALLFVGLGYLTGIVGSILLGIAFVIGLMLLMPVLSYWIPAGFYVVIRDGDFIFSALGKVRKYLSGNFWWTWLIMFVTLMTLGVLQMVFNLPATIVSMMSTFSRLSDPASQNDSSLLLTILYTVGVFLSTCTYSIFNLVAAFNFMSQEEKREGKGLLARIDEIN